MSRMDDLNIEGKMTLITDCVNDDALSVIAKYIVIDSIVNPAPISDEVMDWARRGVQKHYTEAGIV